MRITDEGVTAQSFMDFTIPTEFARSALYCCPQFGHFYCTDGYDIRRDYLDMYLLMYICDGRVNLEMRERSQTAEKGDVVLLDCHHPHRYYCDDNAEFLWLHYFGSSSKKYADYLFEQHGIVFSGDAVHELYTSFDAIIKEAGSAVINEHAISSSIHYIMGRLAYAGQRTGNTHSVLRPAIDYIRENYSDDIDLDLLSNICAISKPHLIRCFKKYIGCTPHEYVLSTRLRHAKQELISSSRSVEEIATNCGFNSASHFARAFRMNTGYTPGEFRNMLF